MDFYTIRVKEEKDGSHTIFADWIVGNVTDLLVNGRDFQAVWDERRGLWSTEEVDVQRLVDADLKRFADEHVRKTGVPVIVKYLSASSNGAWLGYKRVLRELPANRQDLNRKIVFQNTPVKKEDYVTRRLPYAFEAGTFDAWDELIGTLYSPEERAKIEWAIGAVVSGDSVNIQKFLVLYGKSGTGKSTILNIILELFDGYTTTFNAKELTSNNSQFSTTPFADNPLVAVQNDGDLSRIEDNTILNTITAHETIIINQKFKGTYEIKAKAFLFMGTNDPVRIRNAKAGIIRRLIDVTPSGTIIEVDRYHSLVNQTRFELGAIAWHCLSVYKSMGKNYYLDYEPRRMQIQTDVFFNFVEWHHDIFKEQDGISQKQAWELYKAWCQEAGINNPLQLNRFRAELENYFEKVEERVQIDGVRHRNYFRGYKDIMRNRPVLQDPPYAIELELEPEVGVWQSTFNLVYPDQPAQYARPGGNPAEKWEKVTTTLKDLNPHELHFVKIPTNHIVIDFDLVDEDGNKSLERNLEAASEWPPTYAEVSRSGKGLHLHYIYTGNVNDLHPVHDAGIEVKTLLGDEALRRKLTWCNGLDIATISSGLKKKEVKPVIDDKSIKSEKGLRDLIERNIRKEIHAGTKPSVDFIHKILEDAYKDGLSYDVRDMRSKILAFAAKSTNQRELAIKTVQTMRFVGQENMPPPENIEDASIIFLDVEVFPNLFVLCWKVEGSEIVVRMINPTPHEVEPLLSQKFIGFNNRRFDNHILYARYLGHSLEELFRLAQKLIANNQNAYFGEAYNLSYADIYDFSTKKQSLKKFEIELGIAHVELDLPWDQPVPDDMIDKVVEYCVNDVIATEATFIARKQDFIARQILAELSGLTVNHTTQQHTAKIIFGADKNPQGKFVYTDLSQMFEGYSFNGKESTYHGETVGEGGYVYAEPGLYHNVTVLDVASMHPASIESLNLFGPYTAGFSALKEARLAIKRKEYDKARTLLDGRLAKFVDGAESDPSGSEALSYALKIAINIVYGLTSASFDNPFRDPRNRDNIVAKRGALFMIDLKHEVQNRGFQVVHIKTDSIKIPDATPEIIDFIVEFGGRYGYEFEFEAFYEKFCLVNDAVYIARHGDDYTAIGAQFQHPYVYKMLFKGEGPQFDDLCETKSVLQGTIYLDTLGTGDVNDMVHIGRVGSFMPVRHGGGDLWRVKDGKKYAVTGTKGYKWITKEMAHGREQLNDLFTDMDYFERLLVNARAAIEQFGSYPEFVM